MLGVRYEQTLAEIVTTTDPAVVQIAVELLEELHPDSTVIVDRSQFVANKTTIMAVSRSEDHEPSL